MNQTRAEIQELVLKSPVAEARLQGAMDDWRALRYQMNVTSTVDLTQLSDTLQPGTTLRGAGNFAGTVTGEGDQFKVDGEIKSDALAADGLRLAGIECQRQRLGAGQELRDQRKSGGGSAQCWRLSDRFLQLAGNVMGTGTNFRWVGELRAVAEKSYGTTLTGLILRDARAEMNDGVLTATFESVQLRTGSQRPGAKVDGITASNLRLRNENNVTTATVASVKAGTVSRLRAPR